MINVESPWLNVLTLILISTEEPDYKILRFVKITEYNLGANQIEHDNKGIKNPTRSFDIYYFNINKQNRYEKPH